MSTPRTSTGPARILQLDVLRGIAILLVLGNHPTIPHEGAGRLQGLAGAWCRLGWTGVDLFFVLSGFLIGGLLFNELTEHHSIDVRRFLIRRGLKIYPSYYVYIGVLFVLVCLRVPMTMGVTIPLKGGVFSVFKGLASNVVNVQNYLPTIRSHTWSLAVEEHFYLILPFLLLALTRRARAGTGRVDAIPSLPKIAALLMVACTTGRFLAALNPAHISFFEVLAPTHLRLDGLFLGVLLAYYARYSPDWIERVGRHRYALLALGLTLVAPMAIFDRFTNPYVMSFGATLLYLGYGAILCAVVSTPIGEGWLGQLLGSFPARAIAFIGFYSYPVYLWHIDLAQAPLLWLAKTELAGSLPNTVRWAAGMSAYIALATAAGMVMGLAIERPTLALRERLFPRRARALEPDELPALETEADVAKPVPRAGGAFRPGSASRY